MNQGIERQDWGKTVGGGGCAVDTGGRDEETAFRGQDGNT